MSRLLEEATAAGSAAGSADALLSASEEAPLLNLLSVSGEAPLLVLLSALEEAPLLVPLSGSEDSLALLLAFLVLP